MTLTNVEGGIYTPAVTTEPTFVDTGTFIFTHADAGTLTLPAPDFNNQNATQYEQFQIETLNGFLIYRREQTEIKDRRILASWSNVKNPKEVLAFVEATLGLAINVTDNEDQDWLMYIMNPEELVHQIDECTYSVRMELEGSRLNYP